jgi:hypothetical protein
VTTVTVTALDASSAPLQGVAVVARQHPLPFHLSAGEVVARVTATTDVAGVASLSLPPSTGSAYVTVTAGAGRWDIVVPSSGTYAVGDPTIAHGSPGTDDGTDDAGVEDGND